MILDVGCGSRPRGDVNIDLGPEVQANQPDRIVHATMYGSGMNLPYRDNSFDCVHFHGLLHHLPDPKLAWSEMVRVARVMIVGTEPHVFNTMNWRDPHHVFHGFWKRQLRMMLEDPRLDAMGVFYLFNNPSRISLHIEAFKKVVPVI